MDYDNAIVDVSDEVVQEVLLKSRAARTRKGFGRERYLKGYMLIDRFDQEFFIDEFPSKLLRRFGCRFCLWDTMNDCEVVVAWTENELDVKDDYNFGKAVDSLIDRLIDEELYYRDLIVN